MQQIARRLPELEQVPPRPMLSSRAIKEIARDREIGAKSYALEFMGRESDEYVEQDLDDCCARFARERLSLNLYAFPNGSYRQEQLKIEADRGIRTLLVGERPAERTAHALHRITMFGRSLQELRARVARA